MQKILILLLAAALSSAPQPNAEEEVPDDMEAPVTNVHLISSIGVVMIESNNQLKNGDKNLQIGVDFKEEFFDELAMKHAACNKTDSKLQSQETQTLLSSSRELFKELLEELQGKIKGERGARGARAEVTTSTPTIKFVPDKTDEYYSYESESYNSEITEKFEYGRIKELMVNEIDLINNNTQTLSKGTNLFNSDEPKNTIKGGAMRAVVIPYGFVQFIKWTEFTEDRQLKIMVKRVSCVESCIQKTIATETITTKLENATHYETTVNERDLMLHFSTNAKNDLVISNIMITGIQVITKTDNVRVNNEVFKATIIKAPASMKQRPDTQEQAVTNGKLEPYLIFDTTTKFIICKEEINNPINACVFHIRKNDLNSREYNRRASQYLTLNVVQNRRNKRGLLEMLKTGHFFASSFAEERVEEEVNLETQRDEILKDEIKTEAEVTKHVVQATQQNFDLLGVSICLLKEEEKMSKIEGILTQKISKVFTAMSKMVEDCSFGRVSTEIDTNHLRTLCLKYMMSKKMCENTNPVNLRSLFHCKKATLTQETQAVRINLEITFPNIVETKALEVVSIPVFLESKLAGQTKILLLEESKIFETDGGYSSFENCPKIGEITICDLKEEKSKDSLNCIKGIINNDVERSNRYCTTRTEYTKESCFSRTTIAGELVSTREPILQQTKLLEPANQTKGVVFLRKTDVKQSFPCDKRVINLESKKLGVINIIDHSIKLNLTKLMDSERMPYMEHHAEELKKQIQANSETILSFAGATQRKIDETNNVLDKLELPLTGNKTIHVSLLLQIVTFVVGSAIGFAATFAMYKKLKYCCKQKPEYDDEPMRERRRRLLNDNPRRRFRPTRASRSDTIVETRF